MYSECKNRQIKWISLKQKRTILTDNKKWKRASEREKNE